MRLTTPTIPGVAALVVMVLGGCVAERAQPTVLPPLEETGPTAAASSESPKPAASTSTPAPSPSPVAVPVMPPQARENTPEGADAFARHYFAVLDYAFATNDAEAIAQVSEPECPPCRKTQERLEIAASRSERFEGDGNTITSVTVIDASSGVAEIRVAYDSPEFRHVDRSGAEMSSVGATRENVLMLAVYSDGSWLLADHATPNSE